MFDSLRLSDINAQLGIWLSEFRSFLTARLHVVNTVVGCVCTQ